MDFNIVILNVLLIISSVQCNYSNLNTVKMQTKTSEKVQENAAMDVINRILVESKFRDSFIVKVNKNLFENNKDQFKILKVGEKISIEASSGVAATWGFHYYLKEYCNCHMGWQVRQINITDLPYVNITIISNDLLRYYQNVCTVSYSFVWWDIPEWRNHLDWMALNGINIALAPLAQEAAWRRIYKMYNLTDEEIDSHFTGPAFLSWLRMGNIRGWSGPLSDGWHNRSENIQRFIVSEMLNLGMIPILPAFSGYVPRAFQRVRPNANYNYPKPWNRFKSPYCCPLFVDPEDSLFIEIGTKFLTEIVKSYGKSNVYSSDPFNEMEPSSWNTFYLTQAGQSIFSSMASVDSDAIWLLQNWMFVTNSMWTPERVEAMLKSAPIGRILVLDLQAEQSPQYHKLNMYYGQPFLWCMLHNFGGTLGMFGNSHSINTEVYNARSFQNSTMVGIGLTPEGINQNYVIYDLMLESAWRSNPIDNLVAWASNYASRRYGFHSTYTTRTWTYLFQSVYNYTGSIKIHGKYVITRKPSLKIKPWAWYTSNDLIQAWSAILSVSKDIAGASDGYNYDLCDLTRQVLQYRAEQIYIELVKAYRAQDKWLFDQYTTIFLDVFDDLVKILDTNRNFRGIAWFVSAKRAAMTLEEDTQYILNAFNQITSWGPNGEISDYACKQWSEMISQYYRPRWALFLSAAKESLHSPGTFNESHVQKVISLMMPHKLKIYYDYEYTYPNSYDVAKSLYEKWSQMPNFDDLPRQLSTRPNKNRRRNQMTPHIATEEEIDVNMSSIPEVILISGSSEVPYY